MKETYEGSQEQSQEAIIAELRMTLTELAPVIKKRNENRADQALKEEKERLDAKVEGFRTQLQEVMGKTEADRILLNLREELLGESYD
jgi:hypothetical protein